MSQQRLMNILRGPVISEKSTNLADGQRKIVFKVSGDADKQEIKQAVELMFKVDVENVNVLKVKGKNKMFGRMPGKRKDWKKAYVTLKPGQDIDFTAAE